MYIPLFADWVTEGQKIYLVQGNFCPENDYAFITTNN
jgi:hypothetical protein